MENIFKGSVRDKKDESGTVLIFLSDSEDQISMLMTMIYMTTSSMSVRDVILWKFLGRHIVGMMCPASIVPPTLEYPELTAACSVHLQCSYYIHFCS